MKKLVLLLFVLFSCRAMAIINLFPMNMDFEDGNEGQIPFGWALPKVASDNNYKTLLSSTKPFQGHFCAELDKDGIAGEDIYGSIMQTIDASQYRGRKIRFRAAVRAEISGKSGSAHLWVRTHLTNGQTGFTDLMDEQPIVWGEWKYYEIEGVIDDNADVINFGLMLKGSGKAWIDDASFEIVYPNNFSNPVNVSSQQIGNLISFANTYGYLKYFYPSANLSSINWSKFLYTGVKKAFSSPDLHNLQDNLRDMFSGLFPLAKITNSAKEDIDQNEFEKKSIPNVLLSKCYIGPAVGYSNKLIQAKVINIHNSPMRSEGALTQVLDASGYKNKNITVTTKLNFVSYAKFSSSDLVLKLNFMDKNSKYVFYKDSYNSNSDRDVTLKCSAYIPDTCKTIVIALILNGEGKAVFDDVKINDGTSETIVKNGNFENIKENNEDYIMSWKINKSSELSGYNFELIKDADNHKLQISTDKKLAKLVPDKNEVYNADIGNHLYLHFPLTSFSDEVSSIPHANPNSLKLYEYDFRHFDNDQNNLLINNYRDYYSRIAIVIELWNIVKHFDIYTQDIDYNAILRKAFEQCATVNSSEDLLNVLNGIVKYSSDIQFKVGYYHTSREYTLPFRWDIVNGKLYIFSANDEQLNNAEVVEINSEKAIDYVNKIMQYYPGVNKEYKKQVALSAIKYAPYDSIIKLKIIKNTGDAVDTEFKFNVLPRNLKDTRLNSFQSLDKNTAYLNITELTDEMVFGFLQDLRPYSNLIIDLRGTSSLSEHFAGLFLDSSIKDIRYLIDFFAYPDKKFCGYDYLSQTIKGRNLLGTKNVFVLINERTCGMSEVIARILKAKTNVKFIGRETSGSYGDVAAFRLPGDFSASMTFLKFDIGDCNFYAPVKPDIEVKDSLENLGNSIDDCIKKALEMTK